MDTRDNNLQNETNITSVLINIWNAWERAVGLFVRVLIAHALSFRAKRSEVEESLMKTKGSPSLTQDYSLHFSRDDKTTRYNVDNNEDLSRVESRGSTKLSQSSEKNNFITHPHKSANVFKILSSFIFKLQSDHKSQIPNSKIQTMSNDQNSNNQIKKCHLELDSACLPAGRNLSRCHSRESENPRFPIKSGMTKIVWNTWNLVIGALAKRRVMLFSILILLIGLPIIYLTLRYQSKTEAAWYNDGWKYRKQLIFNNADQAENLSNFPVLVKLTPLNFDFSKAKSDGADIRFTDSDGSTLLKYEIESYSKANRQAFIWVKVPQIDASSSTDSIYIYYGNSGATDTQDANNTWNSNYKMVQHFNETSGTHTDSTSTGNNSSLVTVTQQGANIGKIGPADEFDGSDDRMVFSNTGLGMTGGTISVWIKPGENWGDTTIDRRSVISWGTASGGWAGDYCMFKKYQQSSNSAFYCYNNNTTQRFWASAGDFNFAQDSWHLLTITWDSTSPKIYVDGALSASDSSLTISAINMGTTFRFGGDTVGEDGNYFKGVMDELQFSDTVRSAPWIAATYKTQNDTFINVQPEQESKEPIAYWKFDEGQGSTAYDSTKNLLNGSLGTGTSAPTWVTEDQCITGKCLRFDGVNDYVRVTDNALLDTPTAMTYSYWVKANTFASGVIVINSHIQNYGTPISGVITSITSEGKPSFQLRLSGSCCQAVTANTALSANTWYYITNTWDGSNMRIYINGVLDNSAGASGTSAVNRDTFIGINADDFSNGTLSNQFKGFLDEVKIYNYARSAAQVKTDYVSKGSIKGVSASFSTSSNNNNALSQGLVGYWKLDETSSPSQDSSGVGSTGIWNGSVASTGTRLGIGASFDGNGDYINFGNISGLYNTTGFTWSIWFNPSSVSGTQDIIGKWDLGGGSEKGVNFIIYGGKLTVFSGCSGTAVVTSTTSLSANTWYHAVVVGNSTAFSLYINGTLEVSGNACGINLTSHSQSLVMGARYNSSSYYNGKLDEVRMYNRTLSPKEVRDLYNWAPGLSGYWNFDEGSGSAVNNSSGIGNTGTWSGSLGSQWMSGKYGKAGNFNGSDNYVSVTNYSKIQYPNNAFTWETWVKLDTDAATAANNGILKQTGNGVNIGMRIYGGNAFDFSTYGRGAAAWDHVQGTTVPVANKWYHVAMSYDGSIKRIYVNGVLENTQTPTYPDLSSETGDLWIGKQWDGSSEWDGQIDDVRIYDYARTQKQIVEDMNAGHPVGGSPVGSQAGYWKFDEGYGTSVNNNGNGGNTLNGSFGTGSSAPTWTNNGKFGKALIFDGSNDYVSTSVDLTDYAGYTVSFWFNRAGNGSGSNGRSTIIGQDQVSDRIFTIEYDPSQASGSRLGTYNGNNTIYGDDITNGSWVYIAIVENGANHYLYQNGVLKSSGVGNTAASSSQTLRIGGRAYTGANDYFNGLIDDVKVYNYALTADEVKLDYNQGSAMVLGTLSVNTGNTAPPSAASQEYCIPGDSTSCAPPVGEWKLDEKTGTNIYDTSGNGHTLANTDTGNVTWTTGKHGGGLHSNSGEVTPVKYTVVSGDSMDNISGAITMEGWVYPKGTVNDVFGFGGYNPTWGYTLKGDATVSYQNAATTWVNVSTTSSFFTQNTWQHIAITYDGSNFRFYKNGVLIETKAGNGVATANAGRTFGIGGKVGWSGSNIDIDEVRVFNYVRTPAQIAWDYNRGGPVGWWKFDEGSGTTAYDSTDPPAGGGNNGSINIGASGTQTSAGDINTAGTAWYNGATGKFNYSLNLDGTDDWITYSNIPVNTSSGAKNTVAFWMYWNGGSDGMPISFNSPCYNLWFYNANLGFNNCTSNNWGVDLTAYANTWVHVAAIFNNGSLSGSEMYINGVPQTLSWKTGTDSTSTVSSAFHFGHYYAGGYVYGNRVDDLRVYNYALTANQVKNVMNEGAALRFGPSTGSP